MATRRRIGVSIATTEAARRALMQPVPCWEKVWSTPDEAAPGSTLKVYKWVKTDKQQQFSDDEDEVDIPLAPLPDEIEVVDGDEDLDQEQDEAAPTADPDSAIQEIPDSTAVNTEVQPTPAHPLSPNPPSPSLLPDVPSPNRHLLSLQPDQPVLDSHDVLDASLNPLDTTMDAVVDVVGQMDPEGVDVSDMVGMDMSSLGPDGITFENAHDLTQIEGEDALLGGPMMDSSMDPFAGQQIPDLHVHTPE